MRTLDPGLIQQVLDGAPAFSGLVTVDVGAQRLATCAVGLAHRAHRIPVTEATRFAVASGSKASSRARASSLSRDRPASAIRSPAGADVARWWAVSLPTNPVAPRRTRS